MDGDFSDSDLGGGENIFDNHELAQCSDWQVSYLLETYAY